MKPRARFISGEWLCYTEISDVRGLHSLCGNGDSIDDAYAMLIGHINIVFPLRNEDQL